MFSYIYKALRKIRYILSQFCASVYTKIKLRGNSVVFHSSLISNGVPFVNINKKGKLIIGKNFSMNNASCYNPIGRNQSCYFVVGENAELIIGDNVGMSGTALVAHEHIEIGNFVKIGGNTVIYDTDFHSIDFIARRERIKDIGDTKRKPVIIEDDVFIGAHVTIMKGVTIGKGAVIGIGSVVTKNVPPMEVWGGNPAQYIRSVNDLSK